MIIESGVIIFFGMLLLGLRLKIKTSLILLGHPLALDFSASGCAFIMHYGTFSGVMAAAVAGLMCSGFISLARYAIGYIEHGKYVPGKIWTIRLRNDELR